MKINDITAIVIDASVHIHEELGPGLLESVYSVVLFYELKKRGLKVEREVLVAIKYKDISFQEAFRADLIVQDSVILELKSVE